MCFDYRRRVSFINLRASASVRSNAYCTQIDNKRQQHDEFRSPRDSAVSPCSRLANERPRRPPDTESVVLCRNHDSRPSGGPNRLSKNVFRRGASPRVTRIRAWRQRPLYARPAAAEFRVVIYLTLRRYAGRTDVSYFNKTIIYRAVHTWFLSVVTAFAPPRQDGAGNNEAR